MIASTTHHRLAPLLLLLLPLAACTRHAPPPPAPPPPPWDTPAALATWPWPQATRDEPQPGVTHWLDRSSPDGTVLDLLQFDFAANPHLRLELYDQDEDDAVPFDDHVLFRPMGLGQALGHLASSGRGQVIAGWNGLFFNSRDEEKLTVDRHVAPVVLRGQVHHNVGQIRWTFGVRQDGDRPAFKVLYRPDRETLAREFTFAAAGAQCLVRDGRPLRVQPFPQPGDVPPHQPVPCSPDEAGHIPVVDHMRTSRTSLGWSADSARLWLLVVKEPDSEAGSAVAARHARPLPGGWTVADLQRFWLARDVAGAVNLDGGDLTMAAWRRGDGWELVPSRQGSDQMRLTLPDDLSGAPAGGTLMYFYVRG